VVLLALVRSKGKGGGRSISLASSKAKITASSSGTKRASSTATKRGKAAKKVYTLTGQKFDTPEEVPKLLYLTNPFAAASLNNPTLRSCYTNVFPTI
jgi:hypothetical protein